MKMAAMEAAILFTCYNISLSKGLIHFLWTVEGRGNERMEKSA
jgi:hypothetical protein